MIIFSYSGTTLLFTLGTHQQSGHILHLITVDSPSWDIVFHTASMPILHEELALVRDLSDEPFSFCESEHKHQNLKYIRKQRKLRVPAHNHVGWLAAKLVLRQKAIRQTWTRVPVNVTGWISGFLLRRMYQNYCPLLVWSVTTLPMRKTHKLLGCLDQSWQCVPYSVLFRETTKLSK